MHSGNAPTEDDEPRISPATAALAAVLEVGDRRVPIEEVLAREEELRFAERDRVAVLDSHLVRDLLAVHEDPVGALEVRREEGFPLRLEADLHVSPRDQVAHDLDITDLVPPDDHGPLLERKEVATALARHDDERRHRETSS